MGKISRDFKKIRQKGVLTAERPIALEDDALARYAFAVPYCKGKKVLDIGTGLGFGAGYIAFSGASCVLGIDYDKDAINYASSNNKSSKVQYKCLNALKLRNIGEKFDVILAFEIIEHLPLGRVKYFIESLHDILESKGILLITTPNGLRKKLIFGELYNPYHVKEYTGFELKKILKSHYTNIQIKGIRPKNKKYQIQQTRIESSFLYKPIYYLGHFRFIRELVAYVPKNIKQFVTREETLPKLSCEDFKLTKNWESCLGLFVRAEKKN